MGVVLVCKVPIHHVPPSIDVLGACVADVYIVGVLPDVTGDDWLTRTVLKRSHCVVALDDLELAVGALNQERPSRSEGGSSLSAKLLLEFIERSEVTVNRIGDRTVRLSSTVRFHGVPIEGVVPHLRGIVEHWAGWGILDYVLEGEALSLAS